MTQKINIKKSINADEYVNIDTGELLSSEFPNVKTMNLDSDLVLINSKEYVIIDSEALKYISAKFNNQDLGRILSMANMVNGRYNIVYNGKQPHTKESLQKELDYSVNKFRDFIDRCFTEGVISFLVSFVDKKKQKFIVMNPNLARKNKVFHQDTIQLFRDFSLK